MGKEIILVDTLVFIEARSLATEDSCDFNEFICVLSEVS